MSAPATVICEYASLNPAERIRISRRGETYTCARIRKGRTVPYSRFVIEPVDATLHADYAQRLNGGEVS